MINLRPEHPPAAGGMTTGTFPYQMRPFLAADPAGPFVIDAPALASEQNMDLRDNLHLPILPQNCHFR
jgi:hypothetical protein